MTDQPIGAAWVPSAAPTLTPSTRLVVAGYTGRDEAAVRHHIEELAAIGVPPPASVPAYYPLDPLLLTTASEVTVGGQNTSGEVEPVLIRSNGQYWLTVGSDHTDRALERSDIALSKSACPKPIAATAINLGDDPTITAWPDIRIRSWVDATPYQDGSLAGLRPLAEVLGGFPGLDDDADLVLFGGTVPLLDGTFRAGQSWRLTLEAPGLALIELKYSLKVRQP